MPEAGGLYDDDVLLWSSEQADLLRRLSDGEQVNGIDWPHVIEEIEDVGRSELHAVSSLLRQAAAHLLKSQAWPDYQATERSTGMRAGLVGRPRAKSKGYQPADKRAKSQTFGRLV